MTHYHCELAWLGGPTAHPDVLIEVTGRHIATVIPGVPAPAAAVRLPGLTLPGLANAHSHCFHRALRARDQRGRGTFWTWRERMYAVADRLTPDSYHALARAVYGEMVLAGITCVAEFHYLHHGPGGVPYAEPNAMGQALLAAADDAGLRITLLDTCYLAGGFGAPLAGVQQRFGDGDVQRWAERAGALRTGPHARIGAAIHSVRAVPAEDLPTVAEWARERRAPLHAHASEQIAENDGCLAAYGATPVEVLERAGALGRRSTVVHATHLSVADTIALGGSGTCVAMCPTTERDLADGIGPASTLAEAGSPLALGSDSHAVIDLFEEARGVELDLRLATRRRGHLDPTDLLRAATCHDAMGWPDAGRLDRGQFADLVTLRLDTTRLAGTTAETAVAAAVFAATAADVSHVVVGGRTVVSEGRHVSIDVPAELSTAIAAVT